MGWSIGYDTNWGRDIGYGVPATCDHPECNEKIDRGLSFICGAEPYGGKKGCGLYFCHAHLQGYPQRCERCAEVPQGFRCVPVGGRRLPRRPFRRHLRRSFDRLTVQDEPRVRIEGGITADQCRS